MSTGTEDAGTEDALDDTDTEGPADGKLDVGSGDAPDASPKDDCVAQTQEASVESVPVDIVLIADTSSSMGEAVDAVEASINDDFAQVLGESGIDYRLIVLGDHGPLCIAAPLSATDCSSVPEVPAVTPRYQHYDEQSGSGRLLRNLIEWHAEPDPHGLAPGGYADLLRPNTRKVILAMTDGNSANDDEQEALEFDDGLLALGDFGSPGDRRYVFHSIITMPVNTPATAPWLPEEPVDGNGGSIQHVSVLTGGWRFPLSQTDDFDVVFQQIAQSVIESTPIECDFPLPAPPPGEAIDPNTIAVDYVPSTGGGLESFHQVVGLGDCAPDGFYIESSMIHLCPEACATVQADAEARLDVRYGCDVGFDPAG